MDVHRVPGFSSRSSVRVILASVVALFLVVSAAYMATPFYDALKAVNLERPVSLSVSFIYAGATLVAVAIWVAEVVRRATGRDVRGRTAAAVALDGILLALWSAFLLALCWYGYILGSGAF